MRAYEALHQLAERFAPMSEKSAIDLQTQSSSNYMRVLKEVELINNAADANALIELSIGSDTITEAEKETLMKKVQVVPPKKLEHKIVDFAEKWWVRYLISMLFVWVQPKIQNYLNPPPPVEPEYED
jgi:predicted solute-binding protein